MDDTKPRNGMKYVELKAKPNGFKPVGIKGARGSKGTDGEQGIQGIKGTEGLRGEQGHNGENGTNGINGKRGLKGSKGTKGDSLKGHSLEDVVNTFTAIGGQYTDYFFTDGTSLRIEAIRPTGESDDPFWLMGGDSAGGVTVKDIIGGAGIDVEVDQGIYTINATSGGFSVREISSGQTALVTDDVLACTGTFTLDLFTSSDANQPLEVKCVSGTITIDAFGSETIDGNLTDTLTTDQAVKYVPVTAGWLKT